MKCWCYLVVLFISPDLSLSAPRFNVPAPKAMVSNSVLINESNSEGKDIGVNVSVDSFNLQNVSFENLESEDVEENIAEYAGMISINDEASLDDEALVLAHIQSDIEDFEDLKKTVAFLENHLSKHADIHVVKSQELVEADKVLKELDVKVIKFYEKELLSLKSQIPKLKHKFDNQSIDEISLIVENAEMFLQLSMEKIEELEMLEQEWEVAEESAEIQEAIHQEEMWEHSRKILIEALQPSVSDDFKKKLSDQYGTNKPPIAYPTSKPSGIKISLDKSGSEASSMYKKMKKMRLQNSDKKKQEKDFPDERLQEIAEFARIAALESVEENLKKELESDRKGMKDDIDTVEHYSKEVQEALKLAKETSHKFIDKKLYHGAHVETEAVSYLHILLIMFCIIVLVVTLFAFKTLVRRKLSTVSFQNLSGVGGCDRSNIELESVKEDDGWGKTWSPWTTYKKKQNKFK